MKSYFTKSVILFLLLAQTGRSQINFQYDYDLSGNRIQRIVVPAPRFASSPDSVAQIISNIASQQIKLFPNPTKGEITLQLTGYENVQMAKVSVYDIQGKLILEKTALTEYTSIDLTAHKSGNYYLRIFINDKMREWKIVKTN